MNQNPVSILEKGYNKLLSEYNRLNLPEIRVKQFGINPGWNAVIGTNGCCGVAMSFQDNNPVYDSDQTGLDYSYLQTCIGQPLFEVSRETMSDSCLSRRSIGLAALNALSQPFVTDEILKEKGFKVGIEVKDLVRSDDNLVIVGYGGLVKSYAGRCRELHVTDQRPVESFKTMIIGEIITSGPVGITVHPADENREVLADADVAIITGSTLVNGTFNEVVGYAKNARIRALYGSSAQLIPDVLFENGINIAMSVAISDPQKFEYDVMNAPDMETALRKHQRKYNVGDPDKLYDIK
ncbi:Rossmann-like domain-containing protein [Methanospirillum lacunae]|uniref:Heavy-metal chelation domain-containing protein n=1 Tax=Methanospirillum lacunae TaxID=668570 RepID=A0A2V2MYF2_9EURY|nr:DUF364 domain-containing protein [Methanospirillum lacunae]PWR71335.1 hypothetical protein DK846_10745 [Methanospirillum lacunae]